MIMFSSADSAEERLTGSTDAPQEDKQIPEDKKPCRGEFGSYFQQLPPFLSPKLPSENSEVLQAMLCHSMRPSVMGKPPNILALPLLGSLGIARINSLIIHIDQKASYRLENGS
jgi:hypothetical protein